MKPFLSFINSECKIKNTPIEKLDSNISGISNILNDVSPVSNLNIKQVEQEADKLSEVGNEKLFCGKDLKKNTEFLVDNSIDTISFELATNQVPASSTAENVDSMKSSVFKPLVQSCLSSTNESDVICCNYEVPNQDINLSNEKSKLNILPENTAVEKNT